ncbi:MAG: DUF2029 domain-containing protein [Candidatus Lokiarchaeota archaeon]|nr:DUF2029 domain-containing protein [Candidatus Lokiarchaeota archaeon]
MRDLSLKKIIDNGFVRFQSLWNMKIFRYSFLLHIFYYIFSIFLTLIFFPEKNDFLVYYKVGKVFLNNPMELYNPANYNWPFRYLPLSVFLFIPFYLLGFQLGLIIFNLLNLFLNYIICVLLYKIIKLTKFNNHGENETRIVKYICLYLNCLPQIFNYILGQINLYITLLILLSLYFFIKYRKSKTDFIASFFLGLSIILKPTSIFMIPFLVIISYDYENKRLKLNIVRSIVRIFGVIFPITLNFIMFFIIPGLLEGFINVNLTGSETLIPNHSFSITKIFLNFLLYIGTNANDINVLLIFSIISMILLLIGFISYIINRVKENIIIYSYIIGLLIMLLAYFDSWDHHLLNLIPLLIIVIFNMSKSSKIIRLYIKPTFMFLCFLDLAFMGLFWIINPEVNNPVFPFNFIPTIILCFLFYGILKYLIKKPN